MGFFGLAPSSEEKATGKVDESAGGIRRDP
jgi:hypothetical protein